MKIWHLKLMLFFSRCRVIPFTTVNAMATLLGRRV